MRTNFFYTCIILISLININCNNSNGVKNFISQRKDSLAISKSDSSAFPPHWSITDFYKDDILLSKLVDSFYQQMSVEEKAAQMILPATGEKKGYGLNFSEIINLYNKKMIGGVLLLKGRKNFFADEAVMLNKLSLEKKIVAPIFTCDCEPALFHRKITDADSITVTSKLKTSDAVKSAATAISKQISKIGIHWNFAPVVDIAANKEVINDRSFGNDPQEIVTKSIAFIQSSDNYNIATTLKHFPGHGAVKGDSHKRLVYIDSAMTEVDNFKQIIERNKPISVMVGHIAVRNNSAYNTNGLPSSVSRKIITQLLRNSLGFNGIIVTDAMNMAAVKNIKNADYLAIAAGADVIVMPQNISMLHRQIATILNGNSSDIKTQIEHSIKRLIRLKICLNILKRRRLVHEQRS